MTISFSTGSIQPKYYLYRDRFKFNAVDATTQLSPPLFETGKRKYDEFFEEELEVYYLQTSVRVPFQSNQKQIDIQIESQGCADAGLCYPPYKQWLTIDTIIGAVTISDTPSATAEAAMQGRSPGQEAKELSLFWNFGLCIDWRNDSQLNALCVPGTLHKGAELHYVSPDTARKTGSWVGIHFRDYFDLCCHCHRYAQLARRR